MSDQLKPCPFCGSECEERPNKQHSHLLDLGCYDFECGTMPRIEGLTYDQLQNAYAKWNRRASLWQPIETVPESKAGVRVIVWIENGGDDGEGISTYAWSYDCGVFADHHGGSRWKFTHWQPLPEAPKEGR